MASPDFERNKLTTVNESFVIYSANESALSDDGAGFWSQEYGWTTLEQAFLFSESEASELGLPLSTGNDAKWVRYVEAAKHYASEPVQESSTNIEEQIGASLNAMTQEDSRGQVFAFYRENGKLVPKEIDPYSVELQKLSDYEMILFDGGNSAGDFWKKVYFLASKEPKSFFFREA